VAAAAQGLAVDRDRLSPRPPGWGGCWSASHRPMNWSSASGRRGPAPDARWPRPVAARPGAAGRGAPQRGQDRLGRVAGPLADRGQGPGAGQHRGDRDGQHRAQRMPSATPLAGVSELGEVAEQVTALVGCQRGGWGQPLGGRGDGDAGQASTAVRAVMGLDTHMIVGAVPAPHPSTHSPDHHQLDKPALCRDPVMPGADAISGGRTQVGSPHLQSAAPYRDETVNQSHPS
jgi:hypothetical protein